MHCWKDQNGVSDCNTVQCGITMSSARPQIHGLSRSRTRVGLFTGREIYRPEEPFVAEAWRGMFPDVPVPGLLAQPCYAQFAVNRH